MYNVAWVAAAVFCDLYAYHTNAVVKLIYKNTLKTFLLFSAIVAAYVVHSYGMDEAVQVLFAYFVTLAVLLTLVRIFNAYVLDFVIKKTRLTQRIAIVGHSNNAVQLADYFKEQNRLYSVEKMFDLEEPGKLSVGKDGRIINPIENCIEFARKNDIREIYFASPYRHSDELTSLLETAEKNCVRVKFVDKHALKGVRPGRKENVRLHYMDHFQVESLRAEPLDRYRNRIVKRMFDVVFSLLVIVLVLSWLLPLVALLIKLESKGPVFFTQLRSGRNNRPFMCFKFRSMFLNKYSDDMQATRGDARVTRVGSFLRRTSLDEFPQFFNVLKGDMSIVGPRPHMLKHTEKYSAIISEYMVRQFLKPGITGWAQVRGYRGETKDTLLMEKRVTHDIWYMENWKLLLDFKIVLYTVVNILKGDDSVF
ncbi:glycosyltransferase [Filimonas lacunae]|nr:glycosyltransferase [Filimonas lacunae]